ncbi:GntR family transcriptional regulator [Chelatococcus asaccharovorans]|uniref:GntR family transcriptional regulator n=2 Tax=Chelatococcus asaccharovorans TaxID=28210 RepID=A0A2V3U126_9HYPH|nr:GntR family transcriptional regulator [Chelatococcus asaccharovorans]
MLPMNEAPDGADDDGTASGRGKMQDRVLASIQYGLMSGLFVPGQAVSLRKLASSLGTSAMPVRESLSRLLAANVLEELPNRSLRVPRMSSGTLRELFEVRIRIEGLAARIAAEKAVPQLIDSLTAINRDLQAEHRDGNMAGVLQVNQRFHFTLYRHAESDILMPIIEALWLRSGPTMYFSLNSPNLWDTSSHIELLAALSLRDGAAAELAMAQDIRKTGTYLVEQATSPQATGPLAQLGRLGL